VKALLAGGAGFIGSHLCDALLAAGYEVVALDNLITGRVQNLSHLMHEPRFRFLQHDVSDPLPDGLDVQLILQLASPASPEGYGRYPIETMLANSTGTHRLVELARQCGARFLLASTSEAYGDPQVHPQTESYWGHVNPVGPRACYDESKRYAEAMTINYHWKFGLDVRIARIFNCYGPRSALDDGRIVPNFVTQALRGEPITVYGAGQQTRSLCYVDDLVSGLLRLAGTPGLAGELVNLGCPDEHPVLEYATLIRDLAKSSSPIHHLPARPEEIAQRCPDIGKAQRLLQWEPTTSLVEGLRRTIEWFRWQVPPPASGAVA